MGANKVDKGVLDDRLYARNGGRRWAPKRGARWRGDIRSVVSHVFLIALSIAFVFPFIWMLATSLKTMANAASLNLSIIPDPVVWENYIEIFTTATFGRYIANTVLLSVLALIGQVFSSSVVAYSLSHIRWWGRRVIFMIVIATMLIPYQVTMVPVYIIFRNLGMLGSYWPLIIPNFTAGAFYVFLMRQFFMTIPNSLVDASKIDGASHFTIYSKIMVPLTKPALTTIAVFSFINCWSDFIGPLIYISDTKMYTISLGLQSFIGKYSIKWNLIMAASAVTVVPMIVLFFVAQKQFIEGITTTGIKG